MLLNRYFTICAKLLEIDRSAGWKSNVGKIMRGLITPSSIFVILCKSLSFITDGNLLQLRRGNGMTRNFHNFLVDSSLNVFYMLSTCSYILELIRKQATTNPLFSPHSGSHFSIFHQFSLVLSALNHIKSEQRQRRRNWRRRKKVEWNRIRGLWSGFSLSYFSY